jgi:hypothetical protein
MLLLRVDKGIDEGSKEEKRIYIAQGPKFYFAFVFDLT